MPSTWSQRFWEWPSAMVNNCVLHPGITIPTSAGPALVQFQNTLLNPWGPWAENASSSPEIRVSSKGLFRCQVQYSCPSLAKVDHQFWHWIPGTLVMVCLEIIISKIYSVFWEIWKEKNERENISWRVPCGIMDKTHWETIQQCSRHPLQPCTLLSVHITNAILWCVVSHQGRMLGLSFSGHGARCSVSILSTVWN